jgi:hypothetical protein
MINAAEQGLGTGTVESPWEGASITKNSYRGEEAVTHIESLYGITLSNAQKRVVSLEGFVPGYYKDSKGNLTYGVGQTGEYIQKGFYSSFEDHQDRVETVFGPIGMLNEEVSNELIQLMYRGDIEKSNKWVGLFNKANYKGAALELLDHKEYRGYKESGIANSITERLEKASKVISEYNPTYETGEK